MNYNKDNDTDKQQFSDMSQTVIFGFCFFFFLDIELYEMFKILDINCRGPAPAGPGIPKGRVASVRKKTHTHRRLHRRGGFFLFLG